jgi:general stress protein YciG
MATDNKKRGLASASKKTRLEVARKGGEASHSNRGRNHKKDEGLIEGIGEKAKDAWETTKDKVGDVLD